MRPALVAGRIVVAGLVVWIGLIHLHLWNSGYKHIHDIGPLFLTNFVLGLVVAVAVLFAPRPLLPLASLGAAGLAGGTLVGLVVSVNDGLFGFRDSYSAPYAHESILAEILAIAAGLTLTAGGWAGRRHSRSVARPA